MNKIKLKYDSKTYLRKKDLDRIHFFTLAGGQIRGAYLHGNLLIEEMKANHGLGHLETLILGQAFVAVALLTTTLKNEERLNLKIDCKGPIGGLSVDGSTFGEVRGHLFQNPILVPQDMKTLNMAELWGGGSLMVTRKKGSGVPFVSSLELNYPDLATNLVNYCQSSEQIPTALDLSLRFDEKGVFLGGGGLILQALPGASEAILESAFTRLRSLPSIGDNAAEDHDPQALLNFWFEDLAPRLSGNKRVEFFCPCSKKQFMGYLQTLPMNDKKSMRDDGPFPLITTCHNCNTHYEFSRNELVKDLR